jgi:hypothetical protein
MTIDWEPIETAPRDRRLLLWGPGCGLVFGKWDDDRYATRPKPYWSLQNNLRLRITYARENPPTHWAEIEGPQEPTHG